MNEMQRLMFQAQKMQRELAKAKEGLAEKVFSVTKGGGLTLSMQGDYSNIKVAIADDLLEKDNKEMLEQLIAMAITEVIEQIAKEDEANNERITGNASGFGMR
ncbi:MAG: YbaB/EbfC family nucleoid-associated protein [Bacilli bacterium]|jgi:DNA-binding YbaB/EbfC family protein|nr:YbaB/EbfC family nucleoid-associated protein [Bacilli bacterium]MCH4235916.1 YbaB/EbfC family nucleoid-associated protein [Bacilli bacterium]